MSESAKTTTPAAPIDPAVAKLQSELHELENHENAGSLTGEMHQRLAVVRQQLAGDAQAEPDAKAQP